MMYKVLKDFKTSFNVDDSTFIAMIFMTLLFLYFFSNIKKRFDSKSDSEEIRTLERNKEHKKALFEIKSLLMAKKSSQEDIRPQVILTLGNCEEEFTKDALQIIKEEDVSITKLISLVDESIDKTLNKTPTTRFNQFIEFVEGLIHTLIYSFLSWMFVLYAMELYSIFAFSDKSILGKTIIIGQVLYVFIFLFCFFHWLTNVVETSKVKKYTYSNVQLLNFVHFSIPVIVMIYRGNQFENILIIISIINLYVMLHTLKIEREAYLNLKIQKDNELK